MVRELTGLLNLCRCLDKRLPQIKVGLERLPRVLGMPLHAQTERLTFDFDALGNAVGCLATRRVLLPRRSTQQWCAELVWISLCPPTARSSSEPGTTSTGCTGSLSTWV